MKIALSSYSEHCKMVILLSLMVAVPSLQVLLENVKCWWIGSVFAQEMGKDAKCVLSECTIVQTVAVGDLPSSPIHVTVRELVDALDQEQQQYRLQFSEFHVQMLQPVVMHSI
jgi:hypothetical protein